MDVLTNLQNFTPHGFCLAWQPGLIWLMAGSDLAISLAYFSIPAALLVFARRRRDLAFKPVFGLFAAFIMACGTTHVMGAITLWLPLYWLDGGINALTACLSAATALMLWPLLPRALALPSPARLRDLNAALALEIAQRDDAAAKLRLSEDCLRQAQKMEAVGQLTGGIAHDFNNLLTTIMGSLELLQQRPDLDERGQHLAENALAGSRRAAKLTSQLLSFSRRQMLAPESLMPECVVNGIHEILTRTLGRRIALSILPPPSGQWPFLADRNQVESALLNLVINARDATTGDGRVTIGFGNMRVEAADETHPDALRPGDYAVLSVSDTGSGMSQETMSRAFEPFYTTKPPGAGTGLGLSQTYGFAVQSRGALRITSVPGAGTTVTILLPRATGTGEHAIGAGDAGKLRETAAGLQERNFALGRA